MLNKELANKKYKIREGIEKQREDKEGIATIYEYEYRHIYKYIYIYLYTYIYIYTNLFPHVTKTQNKEKVKESEK